MIVTTREKDEVGRLKRKALSVMEQDEWHTYCKFFLWFIQAGRGFGKTWTGGGWINEGAEIATGEYMGLMGRDAHDVRAFMIEGDSGIMRVAKNDFLPTYEPSKRLITWPNGVKAQIFYAEEPKTVRGPNNFRGWADEPASYKDAPLGLGTDGQDTAMSNFLMTLRIGRPQLLVTGTPKPYKLIRDLVGMEGAVVVRGGSRENKENLAPAWFKNVVERYEGTRLGRQEIDGEILEDSPGALWRRGWIEEARVPDAPVLERIVVAIDPPASSGEDAAEAGIIIAGKYFHPIEQRYHYYVLGDRSMQGTPQEWAKTGKMAHDFFRADCIVAERNNGGEMVEYVLKSLAPNVRVITVWASKGKWTRAEPISALAEQRRIHHVGDPRDFLELEDQLCTWEPGMESPDRLDALVWAITELVGDGNTYGTNADGYNQFWGTE